MNGNKSILIPLHSFQKWMDTSKNNLMSPHLFLAKGQYRNGTFFYTEMSWHKKSRSVDNDKEQDGTSKQNSRNQRSCIPPFLYSEHILIPAFWKAGTFVYKVAENWGGETQNYTAKNVCEGSLLIFIWHFRKPFHCLSKEQDQVPNAIAHSSSHSHFHVISAPVTGRDLREDISRSCH